MTLSQILFGVSGRLARLQYLGYSLIAIVLIAIVAYVAFALLFSSVGLALLLIGILGIVAVWMGIAITVKRLHDIGMSGAHAIWILGLGLIASATANTNDSFSQLASLAQFVAWLWLLFAPGQPSDNEYGPAPA